MNPEILHCIISLSLTFEKSLLRPNLVFHSKLMCYKTILHTSMSLKRTKCIVYNILKMTIQEYMHFTIYYHIYSVQIKIYTLYLTLCVTHNVHNCFLTVGFQCSIALYTLINSLTRTSTVLFFFSLR